MKVVYQGPSPEVVIIIEGGGIHALRDVPVDVPDELAKSLLEQDTFLKHTSAVPAAESAAPPQEED